jgi:hypothetical protein
MRFVVPFPLAVKVSSMSAEVAVALWMRSQFIWGKIMSLTRQFVFARVNRFQFEIIPS